MPNIIPVFVVELDLELAFDVDQPTSHNPYCSDEFWTMIGNSGNPNDNSADIRSTSPA